MLLYDVNLNYFRVFMAVYFRRSMTEAAQDLQLTQSGVSQQIKNLEKILGVKLFDRLHRRLIPRAEADHLYKQCEKSLHELENLFSLIRSGEDLQLKGTVRIGLPRDFGANVVMPLLHEFSRQHSATRFFFEFGPAAELSGQLISGEIDLAFSDQLKTDPRISVSSVYREELRLCISPQLKKEYGPVRKDLGCFQKLPYIAYQKEAPVLKRWFAHHFSKKKPDLNIKAVAADVGMAASFIQAGMGAGILPGHFIDRAAADGVRFYQYTLKETGVVNEIGLATLKERHFPPLLVHLLKFFKERLD